MGRVPLAVLCTVLATAWIPCPAYSVEPYVKLKSLKTLQMRDIKRQTLDYSCGTAALSILLTSYFGDEYKEQTLLADITFRLSQEEMLKRMVDGFSMLDLKKTANGLGYDAEGVILPQEAVTALKGPVIILLKNEEANHFVVLQGVSDRRAFIADPSRGHLRVPLYELFQQWHGETLILGREGFGLPKDHPLAIPTNYGVAPERDVVRSLQSIRVE